MEDELLDTEKKQDAAVSNFIALLQHAGWQLLVKMLDTNIEAIRQQILDGIGTTGEKLTEDETALLRENLKIYEHIKNLPAKTIKQYTSPKESDPSVDPYFSAEDMKEKK